MIKKLKDRFANGFSKRCQAEYEKSFAISVDLQSMKRIWSFASGAIIDCYFGNHDICK